MTAHHDLPRIRPEKEPTELNGKAIESAWIGGYIGAAVYWLAGLFNTPVTQNRGGTIFMAAVGAVVGAIIGGREGKQQQEQEQIEGRVVKTPGFWNRGLYLGALVGDGVNSLVNAVRGHDLSRNGGTFYTLVAASGIVGSVIRHNQLQRDFDKAAALQAVQQQLPVISYKDSVSPQEAAALATAHDGAPSHAEKLAEQTVASELATAR